VLGIDHERQRPQLVPCLVDAVDPDGVVDAAQHLAVEQDRDLGLDLRGGDAIGDAVAGTALFDAQHQARALRRAAAQRCPEAEGTAPALEPRRPALDEVERRVPHQRAVAEHPGVGALGPAGQAIGEPLVAVLARQEVVEAELARFLGQLLDALRRQLLADQRLAGLAPDGGLVVRRGSAIAHCLA
jgi:hypothetical protein